MTGLQLHEHLFELVNDSVMTRSMEGRINFWNHSAEQLYGWKKEEAIGRVSHDLLQTTFPKPLEEIESELVRNGKWEGKLVHTTRDGVRVVVKSRWTLNLAEESGPLVEINTATNDNPPPVSKLTNVNDLLPKLANIILAGGGSLCILVLFYSGWITDSRFDAPFGIVLHLVFPAVLAGLLFAFLRQSREFRVNAAIVCVSAAVSLYALELTLVLFPSALRPSVTLWGDVPPKYQTEIVDLARKSGVNFDLRTKFEVVREFRERNINAVPATVPLELLVRQPDGSFKSRIAFNGAEVLPVGGISDRATVVCNETGNYTVYDSDQHGFHNPKTMWESSAISIAAVGDSFTNGACVPSDKNFVALIREQYRDTLNLGMLGEGPLIMLAALKEYLPFLKPKIVLWFFFEENDFDDLLKESKSSLLNNYLKDNFNQGLFHRQAGIDLALGADIEQVFNAELAKEGVVTVALDAVQELKDLLKLSHLRQTLESISRSNFRPDEYSEVQLNLFRNVLVQAKRTVDEWGGKLYFVYLPARDRYANKQNFHRESILGIVRSINLPIIDVHESFQNHSDPLSLFPFGRFGHYNEDGQRVVAEKVLRDISPKR
jgi:PAS domain S-box-containing protein